ncbi:MAG: hypothetical protein QOE36_48 [Gaiellaceae bacterium]|jgi:anti-anti-sigma factor|nr:hypothetical protein [Gaiellaceae bacterium]MDX6570395.1 hypothetical protein [Gaiellales bacterium]
MRPGPSPARGTSSEPAVEVEARPGREHGFAAVVKLRGEHDLVTAPEVRATIASISGNVLVDLSECAFIDSSVIGALIMTSKELERDGHLLELFVPAANETVARTLEVTRIRDLVIVHSARPLGDDATAS